MNTLRVVCNEHNQTQIDTHKHTQGAQEEDIDEIDMNSKENQKNQQSYARLVCAIFFLRKLKKKIK